MIKYTVIFILLISNILALLAGGNEQDSIIRYKDISFSNKFDEQVLSEYFKTGTQEYFKLFLATSKDVDFHKADNYSDIFNNFLKNLYSGRFLNYNPKRQIRILYRSVNNTFFTKYEFTTTFDMIFHNGNYNCVTASALYGIILEHLGIPFYIMETPVHVYIVAYHNKKHIKIESTGPYSGYFVYDQSMKQAFIEFFKSSKLIDETEFIGSSVDELFDKYYFHGNKISLKKLIGIQYMNNAAFDILEENFTESHKNLEKAYLFYPSEEIKRLLYNYLMNIIPKLNYEKLQDLDYLIKLTRYSSGKYTRKKINSEFLKITENCLQNKDDPDYYDEVYKYLSEGINSDEYLKDMAFIYNYEKGVYLFSNGNNAEGHKYLGKALELKENNINIQSAFIQSLKVILEQSEIYRAVDVVEMYSNQFRELSENRKFIELKIKKYLIAAAHSFKINEIKKGEDLLEKFESLYKNNSDVILEEHLIGEAYSTASVYYFKRGMYKKAKEYLSKGLEFAPDNKQLKIGASSFRF
jgi:tetratricopeptide (TPR) repeat protein